MHLNVKKAAATWLTTVTVAGAGIAAWTVPTTLASPSSQAVPVVTLPAPVVPLAFTLDGLVAQSSSGQLQVLSTSTGAQIRGGGQAAPIEEGWGCGSSFVGVSTADSASGWVTTVTWVQTDTGVVVQRTVPSTQRVLGATPSGYAVADSVSSTTEGVDGVSGGRMTLAPLADSWGCDARGYAWSQPKPGATSEQAFARSWSAPTAAPTLLALRQYNLRVLAVSDGTILLSDSHRSATSTRPLSVSLLSVRVGATPTVVWSGADAVLDDAVLSGGASYFRVTSRSESTVRSEIYRAGSDGVLSVQALPGFTASAGEPMGATGEDTAFVALASSTGGLFRVQAGTPSRVLAW